MQYIDTQVSFLQKTQRENFKSTGHEHEWTVGNLVVEQGSIILADKGRHKVTRDDA